ncbi:MAG: hypothetical protein KF718_27350 [Polyangiaceae bacterium]|nr:hypothetical protein [Polyangiaceae bacterium]
MSFLDFVLRLSAAAGVAASAALVVAAPSEASAVFDCLPPMNCRGVQQCCKPPRPELLLQIARAELRRDFYASRSNRDEAFGKGAWDSGHHLEQAFEAYVSQHQDRAAKQRLGIRSNVVFDDVPTLVTDGECNISVESTKAPLSILDIPRVFDDADHPLTRANVCKEAVVAAILHEDDHQDRCRAKKAGLLPPSKERSWARRELDDHADAEQQAYAREADVLRRYRNQARRRCTVAKLLSADKFKDAKKKLQALKAMRQPRTW